MGNKPLNDVFLELLALTYANDHIWSYNQYQKLCIFTMYDSWLNGFIIGEYDLNTLIINYNNEVFTIKSTDDEYKLGLELYKSAKTLYNINSGLEQWQEPYQYDSRTIDNECRNVFKDFY